VIGAEVGLGELPFKHSIYNKIEDENISKEILQKFVALAQLSEI
jgi:hypothetical protein